jgi:hypothetical protein
VLADVCVCVCSQTCCILAWKRGDSCNVHVCIAALKMNSGVCSVACLILKSLVYLQRTRPTGLLSDVATQ